MDDEKSKEYEYQREQKKLEYERKYTKLMSDFYNIACKILTQHHDKYNEFKKYWNDRNYRIAYMHYIKIKYQYSIVLNQEEDKIDKDFYWLFVN